MKRNVQIGLFVLSSLLLTTTCKDLDLDSITDGVVLNLNFDVFRTPVILNFVDASPSNTNPPSNLNVRITGPDQNRVYTTDGQRDITAQDGFMEISVDRQDPITPDNPLQLTVVAEAPGYLKTVQNVTLYDTSFQFIPVNMVSLTNLPQGVSRTNGTFAVTTTGASSNAAFATPLPNGKQERASVTVRSGTRVRDANGNELTGTVNVDMVHFDNRSEQSLNAFPGGLVADNVIGPDGNPLDPLQFVSAGFIALDMNVGNREVKTFSRPVEVTVGINPNTINPETGMTVRPGDTIPVWSLNDDTGQWTYESETVIRMNPIGQMEAEFEADHLSWWNLDWFYGNRCTWREPVTLNLQSNFEGDNTPFAIARLVDDNTGARFGWPRWVNLRNNTPMRLYNIPSDRTLRLQILNSANYYCQSVVYESAPFSTSCQSHINIDVSNYQPNNNLLVQAAVAGICEGENADIQVRPSAWIYFRESGCNYWSYLSYIFRGGFYSNRLELGAFYDFRVYYGGQRYDFTDVPMQSTTITVEDYTLDIELDNGVAYFNIQNLRVPDQYCDDLLGG